VAGLPLLHVGQRRGDSVEHALDVDVDHPVPLVDLEAFQERLRHQPGVVEHDVDAPVLLHGRVHEALHLAAVGDVGGEGERLPSLGRQVVRERLEAAGAPRAQHDRRALRGEQPCGGLAQPAARARDDDDLPFDVAAHGPGFSLAASDEDGRSDAPEAAVSPAGFSSATTEPLAVDEGDDG
jgi:hypothetical protein